MTDRKRFMFDSENFPIKYEDYNTIVYTNCSREVFVHNKRSNISIRVHTLGEQIIVTAAGHRISPQGYNGLPCFVVSPIEEV